MNQAIEQMLNTYTINAQSDYDNALKEIIQNITLLGLWRCKFFEQTAFYGGTCLRILYGLDRFSEDLDFSLIHADENFSITPYFNAIIDELNGFGISATISKQHKSISTPIESAFIKTGTMNHRLEIQIPKQKQLKIKIEIDTNPPQGFNTETKYIFKPTEFFVKSFTKDCLFSGKLHALLCRNWKNRVKGRDWYDFLWYIKNDIPVNLTHLTKRMQQSQHLPQTETLTLETLKTLIHNKIEMLNIEDAKKDILPFIKTPQNIDIWTPELFHQATDLLK